MEIRAIVVDNSIELKEKLTGILKGIEGVKVCKTFDEAVCVVDYVRENPVDLVFSDVVMPDISGISLAKSIYALKNPPEVILLSGIHGFSLEAWQIHAFGFVEKPYTRAQITQMVEKYRALKEEVS